MTAEVMTRFEIDYRSSTYETDSKVRVGDFVVAWFGQEYPKVILSRITRLGSEYAGACRQPLYIIRGGRVIK